MQHDKNSVRCAGRDRLYLLILLSAGLVIRLFLLPLRWINPDEGAHLLDARLLLEGLWPVADFGSRQPLYVTVLALFIKLGGFYLWVGRLMPVLASTGTAVMLYLMGKALFNSRAGLTAAALWLFLPLTVVWAVIVKTEPLTILLGSSSMFLIVKAYREKRSVLHFYAGMLAALAFYVRQPALYLPLSAAIYLLFSQNRLKNLLSYVSGYVSIVVVVFLIFGRKMAFMDLLFSQLNPTTLIFSRLFHLLGKTPEALRIADEGGFRILDQSLDYTLLAWKQALSFTAVLIFPVWGWMGRKRLFSNERIRLLLVVWPLVVSMMYIFQSAHRGFYTQYLTEALPPLILLTAAAMVEFMEALPNRRFLPFFVAAFFCLLFMVSRTTAIFARASVQIISAVISAAAASWVLNSKKPWAADMLRDVVLPVGILTVLFLLGSKVPLHWFVVFLAAFLFSGGYYLITLYGDQSLFRLLLIGFFLSAFSSGSVLGPRYESTWSPETLAACTETLRKEGEPTDKVLSGAGIWTFEAGILPFLNVPHPTEFQLKRRADFEDLFAAQPPQFIIVDGYTQRKFGKYWEFLQERMAVDYEKVAEIGGSKYPVIIYRYKGSVMPLPSLLSRRES